MAKVTFHGHATCSLETEDGTRLVIDPFFDENPVCTVSVGEVEAGLFSARHWRTWLMLGRRLSGPERIKGTYATPVEMGLARTY